VDGSGCSPRSSGRWLRPVIAVRAPPSGAGPPERLLLRRPGAGAAQTRPRGWRGVENRGREQRQVHRRAARSGGEAPQAHPLFRSATSGCSTRGIREVVDLGIASVVDLRSLREDKVAPDAPWVKRGTRHLTLDLPEVCPRTRPLSCGCSTRWSPSSATLRPPRLPGALPVLVHCGSGKGRACVGLAVVLSRSGVHDGRGPGLRGESGERGRSAPARRLFERVAAAGGIEAYLRRHSALPSDVEPTPRAALE
jgi:hypothetical protein